MDPLSVAGSLVGITSLGIQVCQGLISSLRSIEGRKQVLSDSLREVERLISVFYSLNQLLPGLGRRGFHGDASSIRRCLEDSQEKLNELQHLLLKLRGPPESKSIKGKIEEAGRTLVYPFREEKLTSLRQALRALLGNLELALAITSTDSGIAHSTQIDAVGTAVKRLQATTDAAADEVRDLDSRIQDNSTQLRSLQASMTDVLHEIEQRLARTETSVQDIGQTLNRELTVIQSDTTSIVSSNMAISQQLTAMGKLLTGMSQRCEMTLQATEVEQPLQENEEDFTRKSCVLSAHRGYCLPGPSRSSVEAGRSDTTVSRRATPKRAAAFPLGIKSGICSCRSKSPTTSSYYKYFWFGNVRFQYEQQTLPPHERGCKRYGIKPTTKRNLRAQIPLKMGWLCNRITLACLEYATDITGSRMSIRLKNFVPGYLCPVDKALHDMSFQLCCMINASSGQIIQQLEATERAILSLYRDGKASPSDRNEWGENHVARLFHRLGDFSLVIFSDESVTSAAMRMVQTLFEVVDSGDESINPLLMVHEILKHEYGTISTRVHTELANFRNMFSYFAATFEIDSSCLCYLAKHWDTASIMEYLPYLLDAMDLPPIFRAILSRSLAALDSCIIRDDNSPMEKIAGFTTLHLCATWPQGLQKLLATEAKQLIDLECPGPLLLAMKLNCVESVELLMKAGFHVNFHNQFNEGKLRDAMASISIECATAFASNLAERRKSLLKLAQKELGILLDHNPSDVADGRARYICKALRDAGISIPLSLEVEETYATVYHCRWIPVSCFPVLYQYGFRDFKYYNEMGLSPIMIERSLSDFDNRPRQLLAVLDWLGEVGFLDQMPKDPWNLGLNQDATAWHYIAIIGGPFLQDEWQWTLVEKLHRVRVRDKCVCFCSLGGKGCSPLSLRLRVVGIQHMIGPRYRTGCEWSHLMFHHEIHQPSNENGSRISDLALEPVRLLTFEALDMTHTCCTLRRIHAKEKRLCNPCFPVYWTVNHQLVIANRDVAECQQVRSSKLEEENAYLLDNLMQEFARQMSELDPSPGALEKFIWGPWRRRISELFFVDRNVLSAMEQIVGDVETYVLPERLRRHLGPGFQLLRPPAHGLKEEGQDNQDDASSVDDSYEPGDCDL